MNRILSQHGNVIAADFRPNRIGELKVTISTETLYCDGYVTLIRFVSQFEDQQPICFHILVDIATGKATHL